MTGNTGFLGVPMLVALLGPYAVGPVLMVLILDMVVFSVLITSLVTIARQGRVAPLPLLSGVLRNPMIVSMGLGLIWAEVGLGMPQPLEAFTGLLGAAATPGALFAIGASLAAMSVPFSGVALWLSALKLFAHPGAVGLSALLFAVTPQAAGVMIAAAALPVAGNVYMLAQHYAVVPGRVSAAIFISTLLSILTIPVVIAWVS